MHRFDVGKLPHDVLSKMISKLPIIHDDVVVAPKIGEDAAVIDLGDRYLVVASDPITFTAKDIGFYLVTINANDIAVMGAKPRYLIVTLLLPENLTDAELVNKIFDSIASASRSLEVSVIGGHTEITYGIDRPIAIGTMLGFAPKGRLITSSNAKVGDVILLTKGIAIEGTSIIAKEKGEELGRIFGKELVEKAAKFTAEPGISVVREALIAAETGCVHAMHDPTEGGLATALFELATASDVGLLISLEDIPIYRETREFCRYFHIDPLGLLASGALLIVVPPECAESVESAVLSNGIPVRRIGEIKPKDFGLKMLKDGKLADLPVYHRDELTKIL